MAVLGDSWCIWVGAGTEHYGQSACLRLGWEFEKDKIPPSITLITLENIVMAQSESGGENACLNSYHNQSYSKRSISGGG